MAIDYTKEEILNPGSKTYSENPFFLKPGESQADYLARTNQPAPYVPGSSTTSATGKDVFGNPVAAGTPIVSPTISTAVGNGITRTTSLDEFKGQREAEKKALAEEARIQRQAIIDAINTRYGAKSQRVQEEGNQALASQRSINLRSGLGGSDFGSAAKADVRVKTSKALDVVEAEKQQELSSAIAAIEQLTLNKQEAARQGRLDEETFVKDLRAGYEKTLASLKKAGTTIDKLRNTEVYQDYLDAGLTDIEIDAALKPDQEDYIYSVLSDGRVARYKKSGGEPEFFAAPANLNPNAEITAYKDGIYQQTPEVDADGNITGWKLEKLRGFASDVPTIPEGQLTPKQTTTALQLANSLKNHPSYRDMLDIQTGMQGVESGLSQKNGFGDIAAINAFQKMVDPGATVREGDVSLLQSASSLIDKVLSDYPIEKLKEGDKLPEEVRNRMKKTAKDLYSVRAKNYNEDVGNQYKSLSKASAIPFEYVGQEFSLEKEAPSTKTIKMSGPQGTFEVPEEQVANFKQNGYKEI